jgi:hypothetical protein
MQSTQFTSLSTALQFIQQVEQNYPSASTYEIANRLRGHTKPAYTTKFWTLATGFKQDFVFPNLDGEMALAGEMTDFGHFIAALSDQINQPGLKLSDLTGWTADHTSWAGDIGSAIVTFCRQPAQFATVTQALDRYANDSDYAANIAAYIVADMLKQTPTLKISQAIQNYNADDFANHVRSFLMLRFGDGDSAPPMRRAIVTYLNLAADSGLWGWMRNIWRGRSASPVAYTEAEINQGISHFTDYLRRQANFG